MRKPLSLALFIGLLWATNACSQRQTMLAPTTVPAAPARINLSYDINLPTVAMAQSLIAQYPHGINMAPISAQIEWNYTHIYGGPNVYFGPSAPAQGVYIGVGIVVAPIDVASRATFPASAWPALHGSPSDEYAWLGRFVYAAVRKTP